MGHHCLMKERLEIKNGRIIKTVRAYYDSKKLGHLEEDIYREEHLFGSKYIFYRGRYFDYYPTCGFLVTFPGEKLHWYYGDRFQEEYEMDLLNKRYNMTAIWERREEDLKKVEELYPNLHYLIAKYKGKNVEEFIKVLKNYCEDNTIEMLIQLGYVNLAQDQRLRTMSSSKKKEILKLLKSSDISNTVTLSELLFMHKYNIKYKDLDFYTRFNYNKGYADWVKRNYLDKEKYDYPDVKEYKSYKDLVIEAGHDIKDSYWAYPSDYNKQKDKVEKEVQNIRYLKEQELAKKKLSSFKRIGNKLSNNNKVINTYSIYIPTEFEDVKLQADKLNQCLIRADYIKKVAEKKSILVFVRKNDNPVATYEIDYDKKILQQYANEKAKNIHPTEACNIAFNQWLESAVI